MCQGFGALSASSKTTAYDDEQDDWRPANRVTHGVDATDRVREDEGSLLNTSGSSITEEIFTAAALSNLEFLSDEEPYSHDKPSLH